MFNRTISLIILPAIILLLLATFLTGRYAIYKHNQLVDSQLKRDLITEAIILGDTVATLVTSFGENSKTISTKLKAWSISTEATITVIAADGSIIASSDPDNQTGNYLNYPEIQEAMAKGVGTYTRYNPSPLFNTINIAVSITDEGDEGHIIGFLHLSKNLERDQMERDEYQKNILTMSLRFSLLAISVYILFNHYAMRPLRQLIHETDQILAEEGTEAKINNEFSRLTMLLKEIHKKMNIQTDQLKQERNKLGLILNQASDGVMFIDQQGQIATINLAAIRWFETKEQDAIGNTLANVVRHHQVVELWQRCRDSGEGQIVSFEIPRRKMFIQCAALPLYEDSKKFYLLLFRDLTHLQRLETVRKDFVSNISHELRTPLASLKALTETLLSGAMEDPQASRRFIERIEMEIEAMSRMVQDLLELSRIESGKAAFRFEPTMPNEIIYNVVARVSHQVERKALSLEIDCPEDLPLVLVDPPHIEQVLNNLLDNAIKFTPSGGKITLTARKLGDTVVFSLRDTGIGIPADDLPRIFERFYKSDKARSSSGVGLGLAIARHIVEAHQGEIHVESKEGHGSTFAFSVPIAQ